MIDKSITEVLNYKNKAFTLGYTLDEITKKLDASMFFRANRQFIIARKAIKDVDLWFNNRLSVNLKVNVPAKILISRARSSEFKNWFTGN